MKMNIDPFLSFQSSRPRPLSSEDVHVWRTPLTQPADRVQELAALLSPDERARADKFHFAKDRCRFIVGRGLLRMILGGYLDVAPTQIEFYYGRYGKPAVTTTHQGRTLEFSLSHSQDVALYAVSWDRQIGVDVEYVRPISDMERFVERFFAASERAIMRSLPAERRLRAFFTAWTSKEAYLKAIGAGLSRSLDQIEVSFAGEEAVRLISVDGDRREAARWKLATPGDSGNYAATLAAAGHDWRLTGANTD